jgi:uncharacterized protein YodC (DUF2158 family)
MKDAEADFKIGALVVLNSGGPELTVHSMEGDKIKVCWFEGVKLKEHVFSKSELKPATERKLSDLESARRVAFVLNRGARQIPGFETIDPGNIEAVIGHIVNDAES